MSDINILTLVKGDERYVFMYRDGQETEVLRALRRSACNPELSFNWYDAVVLSDKVRERKSSYEQSQEVDNG